MKCLTYWRSIPNTEYLGRNLIKFLINTVLNNSFIDASPKPRNVTEKTGTDNWTHVLLRAS
jgi:hypothetical protein